MKNVPDFTTSETIDSVKYLVNENYQIIYKNIIFKKILQCLHGRKQILHKTFWIKKVSHLFVATLLM